MPNISVLPTKPTHIFYSVDCRISLCYIVGTFIWTTQRIVLVVKGTIRKEEKILLKLFLSKIYLVKGLYLNIVCKYFTLFST